MNFEELKIKIQNQTIEPEMHGVDLKSDWQQSHGKDIAAIANNRNVEKGWIVIGVGDDGKVLGKDLNWLQKIEEKVSNHIHEYLEPVWITKVFAEKVDNGQCLFIEISNPDEVVKWNGKAYHLIGTISTEMKPHEVMELSLKLPGTDFSKGKYSGDISASKVIEFAQKASKEAEDFEIDVNNSLPSEILTKLKIYQTNTAGILFGDFPYRIVHFNQDGDILDQKTKYGLYDILSDNFIEEIQSRARKKGTEVKDGNIAATEEMPYPLKALREILANAVAHALYQKAHGDIVVETHPDRITVRNNCSTESKAFVDKWFSRINKPMNKHLMNTLRIPRITDEQGSGKIRIFRFMLESGKRAPIIDYQDLKDYGRWSITLFNDEVNLELKKLAMEIKGSFPNPDHWRIATALLLWRNKSWFEIEEYLDAHYKAVAQYVLENPKSPVLKIDNSLYTKRWARIRLEGQLTKKFSEGEKASLYKFLNRIAFKYGHEGHISSEEAREIIGLSNSKSEMTQLARLFGKWKDQGLMKMIKKGQWQFLSQKES